MDTYSKLPRLSGIENINTKEVMENLDEFHARFMKGDEFGWWDLEQIQTDDGMHFTSN